MNVMILTCEHAGNHVPDPFKSLFAGKEEILSTHRAWDPGSYDLARFISKKLELALYDQQVSRLLVEMNRSLNNNQLFSEYSSGLNPMTKNLLLNDYYRPYRDHIEYKIRQSIESESKVVHISVHTFTPVLDGKVRDVEIGLLCDESVEPESLFCSIWLKKLKRHLPNINVQINAPYNGADDGFTTYLRSIFPASHYLGIELEVNQKFVGTEKMNRLKVAIATTLHELQLLIH